MKLTTNLKLKKPDLTDYVNVADFNDNADFLDLEVSKLKEGSTTIEDLKTENKTLSGAINELKTEVDKRVVKVIGKGLSDENYTSEEKEKLVALDAEVSNVSEDLSAHLAEYAIQMATGTANAITVATGGDFKYKQGNRVSFKAISNSTGAVTINIDSKGNKSLKKLDGTNATIKSNKVYEIFYSVGDNCFFLLASAEGDAVAGNVLAGKYFSNDDDVGILGTMPNNGTINQTITSQGGQVNIPSGYIGGGSIKAQFANLTPENIAEEVNIGGIVGSLPTTFHDFYSVGNKRMVKTQSKIVDKTVSRAFKELLFSNVRGNQFIIFITPIAPHADIAEKLFTLWTSGSHDHHRNITLQKDEGKSFVFITRNDLYRTEVRSVQIISTSLMYAQRIFPLNDNLVTDSDSLSLYASGYYDSDYIKVHAKFDLYELR